MINALLGKEENGIVDYIYWHDCGTPTDIAPLLLKHEADNILSRGNITSLGDDKKRQAHVLWAREKPHYAPGGEVMQASVEDFFEQAMADVQYVYLFKNGVWHYMNTCLNDPHLRRFSKRIIDGFSGCQGHKITLSGSRF